MLEYWVNTIQASSLCAFQGVSMRIKRNLRIVNRLQLPTSLKPEATQRQVRLRSTSYGGTSQPKILRRQLIGIVNHPDNKSGLDCQYLTVLSIPVSNIPSQVISLGCVTGMLKQVYISQTDKMF